MLNVKEIVDKLNAIQVQLQLAHMHNGANASHLSYWIGSASANVEDLQQHFKQDLSYGQTNSQSRTGC